MKQNVGMLDRIIRIAVVTPLALVLAAQLDASTVGGVILLTVAGIMFVTGAVGFCPLYALLRIDTRSKRAKLG